MGGPRLVRLGIEGCRHRLVPVAAAHQGPQHQHQQHPPRWAASAGIASSSPSTPVDWRPLDRGQEVPRAHPLCGLPLGGLQDAGPGLAASAVPRVPGAADRAGGERGRQPRHPHVVHRPGDVVAVEARVAPHHHPRPKKPPPPPHAWQRARPPQRQPTSPHRRGAPAASQPAPAHPVPPPPVPRHGPSQGPAQGPGRSATWACPRPGAGGPRSSTPKARRPCHGGAATVPHTAP